MPNIKSAIKRVNVTEKKNAENKATKSRINTYIKKFKTAVAEKNAEEASKLFSETVSLLDSAVSKGVLHANNASRKQARLAKLLESVKA